MAVLQSDGVNNATDLILRRNGTEALRLTSSTVQVSSINDGPLAGFRNAIINGNFDFWQRGTSFTNSEYGADRWLHARAGTTHTATRQAFTVGQTAVPGEPTYFCRTVVSSVAGVSNFSLLVQRIEDVRSFAGQQVTVSFWAKVDTTKNISVEFRQQFGLGGSPSADISFGVTKVSIGTTFQKVTVTATVPSISGKTLGTDNNHFLGVNIWFDSGSNFNANNATLGHQSGTFEIAQVQVEAGPVATPFERRPIGTELALCQRYFEVLSPVSVMLPWGSGTQIVRIVTPYRITKRVSATVTMGTKFGGTGTMGFADQNVNGVVFFGSGAFQDVIQYAGNTADAEF